MGCGISRSPARIGVITEDHDSLYEEFLPSMMADWMVGESARDVASTSLCNSHSPPPYTPLPLSGHVTLLIGSSPAKRQNSNQTSVRGDRESMVEDEELNETVYSSSPPWRENDQRDSSMLSSEMMDQRMEEASSDLMTSSQQGPIPIPRSTVDDEVMVDPSRDPLSLSFPADLHHPLRLDILSSSLPPPPHRPPSPFPRSRSLSFQLPPLRTIQSTNEPPPPHPLSTPHHLPPLRELAPLDQTNTDYNQLKMRRRERRSRSCQEQTSSLISSSSLIEQNTIPLIQ